MDSVIRNVADLSANERHVYENVLGQLLRDNQQVVVKLVDAEVSPPAATATNGSANLPALYTIWADLNDAEIAVLESAILQRSNSRPT
jgi:hypothetical protein